KKPSSTQLALNKNYFQHLRPDAQRHLFVLPTSNVIMNILESQVNDLNYIAESPIAIPVFDTMNGQQQQPQPQSSESPADTGAQSGKKRKNDSAEGAIRRRMEIRKALHIQGQREIDIYRLLGPNECKRRKIKCNGNTPCQRCGNLNLECQYAPNCCTNGFKESEEFRRMNLQLASLQEQVNNLNSSLNAMRHGGGSGSGDGSISYGPSSERSLSISQQSAVQALSPLSFHHKPIPRHPSFRGPTSSAFGLDVAKNTLHNMGYQSLADEGITTQDPTPVPSPPPIRPRALPSINMNGVRAPDPLRSVNREEMTRLCRVYEEEMGLMYPVVDIEELITHGSNIF
ncbi:fungal specific transcription factor domain-containing protein, partial [Botrytis cinerea]